MTLKKALIIFAWVSIFGSIGDGLITLYGGYLVLFDSSVQVGITVEHLISNYIDFLYWIKQVAYLVLPSSVVNWLFELPALVYFLLRMISSLLIGWWMLKLASKMP